MAADTSLGQVVQHGSSTHRLWHGEKFDDIKKILVSLKRAKLKSFKSVKLNLGVLQTAYKTTYPESIGVGESREKLNFI